MRLLYEAKALTKQNSMRETPPITFLSLLRKYGGNISLAHQLELRAAARAVPIGTNKLKALSIAAHNYKVECQRKYGKKRLCYNRDGLCEKDKCNCH